MNVPMAPVSAANPETRILLHAAYLGFIICAAIVIAFLIAFIRTKRKEKLARARQEAIRSEACNSLGITIPRNVRITENSIDRAIGIFELGFPSWGVAKADGTRDRRKRHNTIIYSPTVISVRKWILSCNSPLDGYALVLNLRQAGNEIALCTEEIQKRDARYQRRELQIKSDNLNEIIERYRDTPTEFESFCAQLYRSLKWRANTTPAVRDGGFDLTMRRPDGLRYIAECKCYSPQNHVGRPIVQKLLGANAVQKADGMMLITTSSFTSDAREYARQVGIELVDGKKLVRLCRQAWSNSYNGQEKPIGKDTAQLTTADILAHYPMDMRVEPSSRF